MTKQELNHLQLKKTEIPEEVKANIAFAEEHGLDKLDAQPPAQTREMMKQIPASPNPTPVGSVTNFVIPDSGINTRIYKPAGAGPFPVIVYFHGGGFVLMSLDTHDEICRRICAGTGCVLVSVDYRLAPEHPYPEGPESCVLATKWMIQNAEQFDGRSDTVAVAGDSAGGYMALFTARALTKAGFNLKAQFAAYPVTDHYSQHYASWEENKDGYVLSARLMKWFWDQYLTDPTKFDEASPLRSSQFAGLPPALIMTGELDPLRDEGRAYAAKIDRSRRRYRLSELY